MSGRPAIVLVHAAGADGGSDQVGNAADGERHRSVLHRANAVLSVFTEDKLSYDIAELATATGIPRSSVHRLAGELVELGLLRRDSDGHVSIGTRLWEIAEYSPLAAVLRESALPHLTSLYRSTHESAHAAVLEGDEVLYVARVVGLDSERTLVRVGGRLPLHTTGVGKAILAATNDDFVARYVAHPLLPETRFSITDPHLLWEEIRAIRERGYATTREEMTLGTGSIAASLPPVPGWPPIAVGIVLPVAHELDPYLPPLVVRAAQEISREMAGG